MKEAFLSELKELMLKYNVCISSDIEGDTHGIHSEKMIISIGKDDIKTISGYEITAHDL